jgi:Arc/MetJ family transcription regulator
MRTTLNIEDDLIIEAGNLLGIHEKSTLVQLGLKALIEREAARKLAQTGGSVPRLKVPARPRSQ